MMAFVLKQYPPPPEPEQAIINYYQAKHDFATTAILQPEGTKLYLELLEDSRALGILHYHLRNRLDATAKCIDSLIPSIGNRNEVVCYMRIWSALVSAHENAISRSESSKSSDDRQIASSEAIRLATAENLMMGLIAGATGFDREFIITFAYDDIANSVSNPFKGKVFNKPTYKEPGVDVYAGIKIDYSKAHVTPEVFQAVLEGNKELVKGKGS
jgi:hypothetical protein